MENDLKSETSEAPNSVPSDEHIPAQLLVHPERNHSRNPNSCWSVPVHEKQSADLSQMQMSGPALWLSDPTRNMAHLSEQGMARDRK